MKFDGLDALIAQLERMDDEIEDDVDEIVKNNALEFSSNSKNTAKKVMNKGYWTGNLAGLIKAEHNGKMNASIWSNAHYSGFLEYGTRYMSAAPYFLPTYKEQSKKFKDDLDNLING